MIRPPPIPISAHLRWTMTPGANKCSSVPKTTERKDMQTRNSRKIIATISAAGGAGFVAGCASMKSASASKELDVTMEQMSEPARATIKRETAGGTVDKITRETERGKIVYDVEGTVGGKHME